MRFLLTGLLITISICSSDLVRGAADRGKGFLGVALADAPPENGVPAPVVMGLAPNGPASRAGLRVGDVIRAVDRQTMTNADALQAYVSSHKPGDVLVFDIMRRTSGGSVSTRVTVTLGVSPQTKSASPNAAKSETSRSNSIANKPSVESRGDVKYHRFVDPAEQAFVDSVPVDWRVGGRLVRYGPLTIAPFIQAMSRDGMIFIQLGDWHIKDYSDMPGWRSGSLYTPGTSIIIVRRVETAEQYARSYGLTFQKQLGCDQPEFPEMETVPNPAGLFTVPQSRTETRVAHFTCLRGGQRYVGRIMATVQAYRLPMSTGWNVLYRASYLAREDRAGIAQSVWDEMRGTFQFLPEWSARQSQIAREAVKPAQAALDNMLRQTQAFDEHVINGNMTVHDPTTGSDSEIKMGVDPFYFADGVGHFYNSYDPTPRSGFHPIQPKRPDM